MYHTIKIIHKFFKKTLDSKKKSIYNSTMMKTIHSFKQSARPMSWLPGYCLEINVSDTAGRLEGVCG
jgi:hypothetical protein